MLPCSSFNFLHHDFIYETERSAWPSYGNQNEIGKIISAPKNDKSSDYLCQLEWLCGCKFRSHLEQKNVSAVLYRYRKRSELEQVHLTYSANFFKLWPVVVTKLDARNEHWKT